MVGEIAEEQNVPRAFLAKILQKLVKAGIATSVRGVKGGFSLVRAPKEISVLEVIEAVHGPVALNRCVIDSDACDRRRYCAVHPLWASLRDEFRAKLKRIDFARLLRDEKALLEGANKKTSRRRV